MQRIEFTGLVASEPMTIDLFAPETAKDGTDESYCTFDVAVRRLPRGKERKVDYYRLRVYNKKNTSKNGESCQRFLKKGMKVFCWGELQPELVETPEGRFVMELGVRAPCVEFLNRKGDMRLLTPDAFDFPEIPEEDYVEW